MSLSTQPLLPSSFVFDLDGTLVDSAPGIAAALSGAFAKAGIPMPSAEIRTLIGPPIRKIARRLDPSLTEDQTAAIERAYRSLYDNETWLQTTLFPGVQETLHTLRASGCRLFLLTNKPQAPTIRILSHFSLLSLFDDIATRDLTAPPVSGKSAMLASMMERNRINATAAALVGDTSEDEEAATANGLRFLFAAYGYGESRTRAVPLACFADLLLEAVPAG